MGADYYSILGVPKTATEAEIATAYKKKALRCHPDKLRFKPGMSEAEKTKLKNKTEEEFKQVAQAYQVLSDKEKRPIYDKYGEEGLNGAMGQGFGGGSQTFYTNVDPRTVFESFFKGSSFGFNMDGEDNGHTMSFVTNGSGPESIFSSFGMGNMGGGHNFIGSQCGGGSARRGHRQQPQQMEQDPPVMYDLGVTLEELMTGTNKKMKITITDYNTNQKTASEFDIAIQKSWKEGTKITYEKMGDKHPGRIPADIIFVLKDKPHPHFKRDKDNNLIYTCNISLKDALIGCRVNVPLLGEVGTITKSVPGVIKPTSSFVIEGKGLPLKKNDNRRANLIVKFDITFPSSLTPQEAEIIRNLRSM